MSLPPVEMKKTRRSNAVEIETREGCASEPETHLSPVFAGSRRHTSTAPSQTSRLSPTDAALNQTVRFRS
jgi:hypothetical protein